jgi:hypothetical protein
LSEKSVSYFRGARSDRAQLAVPDENANHHELNESNAAKDRKDFFGCASPCMIPLLQQTGERQDAKMRPAFRFFLGR